MGFQEKIDAAVREAAADVGELTTKLTRQVADLAARVEALEGARIPQKPTTAAATKSGTTSTR